MGQTLGRAPLPQGCKRFLNRKYNISKSIELFVLFV